MSSIRYVDADVLTGLANQTAGTRNDLEEALSLAVGRVNNAPHRGWDYGAWWDARNTLQTELGLLNDDRRALTSLALRVRVAAAVRALLDWMKSWVAPPAYMAAGAALAQSIGKGLQLSSTWKAVVGATGLGAAVSSVFGVVAWLVVAAEDFWDDLGDPYPHGSLLLFTASPGAWVLLQSGVKLTSLWQQAAQPDKLSSFTPPTPPPPEPVTITATITAVSVLDSPSALYADGVPVGSGQCVALVKDFAGKLGNVTGNHGNAADGFGNFSFFDKSYWTMIPASKISAAGGFKNGDIVYFDRSWGEGAGHVGIVTDVKGKTVIYMDQNGYEKGFPMGNGKVTYGRTFEIGYEHLLGVMRYTGGSGS